MQKLGIAMKGEEVTLIPREEGYSCHCHTSTKVYNHFLKNN